MNVDKSFSNLTMSEKRKRLMALVDMRKSMKRKRYEIHSMIQTGESVIIKKPKVKKKPINESTKMNKFNAHTFKKLFQNKGPKVKKLSHIDTASDPSNDSSEIEEYWVPVHLSHMQIETYCSLLNSNLEALSSSLRDDSSLSDILTQTQKCCDHPYLVDPTLRESLKTDVGDDRLDAEISVSGKLQLLDKLLLEIKKCGLRVLVLFQSPVTWKTISLGDILDDLVDKRFGHDSYIRIHGKIISNQDRENRKRNLKMFNNLESGKFVCLLDSRICHPTMRLSSIDVVILFNSDWNPLNDIKALRKLTLDSNRVRVLRLYSSFTIEEKALILSKERSSIYDNSTGRVSYSSCNRMLAWGASYLFSQLSKNPSSKSKSKSKSETCFMEDLVEELSSLLLNKNRKPECIKSSSAPIQKGSYSKNISLLGENEEQTKESCSLLMKNGQLVFWRNMLQESPWKNSSCSRLSKRVKKPYRNPGYWCEGNEAEYEIDTSPPSVRTKPRSKRRVSTEVEQSTNCNAECTNDQRQRQQPQPSPVPSPVVPVPVPVPVPPVSDHASPLETELENIKKEREKVNNLHEEKKLMLNSECEKEILEIRKKYDALIDESEICLTKEMNVLQQYYDLVYANKVLADTFTQACDVTFNEEKSQKESGGLRVAEIPASQLVQSRNRCTSTTSMPTLRAPAPHLRSSPSLIPQAPKDMKNVDYQENSENLSAVQSSQSVTELLEGYYSFYDMGYPNLPFLDSNSGSS
ncbi:hypothetical protein LXL04_032669 [Taraxacum kok-saghyz]